MPNVALSNGAYYNFSVYSQGTFSEQIKKTSQKAVERLQNRNRKKTNELFYPVSYVHGAAFESQYKIVPPAKRPFRQDGVERAADSWVAPIRTPSPAGLVCVCVALSAQQFG